MKFYGSGVALVTPFKGASVNYEVLEELLDFHLINKTDFLVILGSTGEAATISLNEKRKIVKFVTTYVNKRIPIMVGSGTNNTKESIKLTKEFEKLGANGFLVVTPYYNRPSQKGIYEHCKRIAKATTLPVMLYNVPSRTASNMDPKTVYELSKINNIFGIKEASGDLSQIEEIINITNDDFILLSGNDDQTLDILKLGGKGAISVSGNIIPLKLSNLINGYLNGENIDNKFNVLLPLFDSMFIESNPVPVKKTLEFMGFKVGKPRLPLVALSKSNEKILLQTLKREDLSK